MTPLESALPIQAPASSPAPAPKPAPEPEIARAPLPSSPAPKPVAAEPTKANTTGGISPAVVYLQNLKLQMEHFEKEINQLRGQVSAFAQKHDKQFDDLLTRIGELQGELHEQVHGSAPSINEEAPEALPPQAAEPAAQEPAELKLEPPPSAQEDILKPKGKGPVWPV